MSIIAKYPAICSSCHGRIAPGAKIEWTKGQPVRHSTCAGPTATSTTSARTSYSRRTPMGSGHGSAPSVPGYSSYCTDRPGCRCYDCQ